MVTEQTHEYLLRVHSATQESLEKMFAGIPEEHFFHQPFPGANHAMWTMGHLATVDQYFLHKLAGHDGGLFERHQAMFFAKSQPSASREAYPPIAAVRDYFKSSRAAFRTWIESLDDAKLAAPLSGDMQRAGPNLGTLLFRLLWHEGMHYGQLAVIRKSLGLAPTRI